VKSASEIRCVNEPFDESSEKFTIVIEINSIFYKLATLSIWSRTPRFWNL